MLLYLINAAELDRIEADLVFDRAASRLNSGHGATRMNRMITDFCGAGAAWNRRIGPFRRRDRDVDVALSARWRVRKMSSPAPRRGSTTA